MSRMECKLNVHNICVAIHRRSQSISISKRSKALSCLHFRFRTYCECTMRSTLSVGWKQRARLSTRLDADQNLLRGNSYCSFFVIFMQLCSSQVPSRMMDQNYWPSNSSLPYWFWDLKKHHILDMSPQLLLPGSSWLHVCVSNSNRGAADIW